MVSGDIAIIGAGMAGLSCATELKRRGLSPVLFDKGRGPGGRMAARRVELDGQTVRFDHGAQFFIARDEAFAREVAQWVGAGVVAPWSAAGDDCHVGVPAMNAPLRYMAESQNVSWGVRVEQLRRVDGCWELSIEGEARKFTKVIVAIPPEQAAILLADCAAEFAATAAAIRSEPCWAVTAAFSSKLPIPNDTLRPENSPIGWAARNSAKPGRSGTECWVIHASPEFSTEILEHSPEDAAQQLLAAFFKEIGIAPVEPQHLAGHRWRYAMSGGDSNSPAALWDAATGLGVTGDWLIGPRVESAWLSGRAMAGMIAPKQA